MNAALDAETQASNVSCPLCGNPTAQILTRELRRGAGMVFYCTSCEHGFLMPDQTIDAKTYYAEHYRQEYSHHADVASINARELFDVYRHYQRGRLEVVAPYLTPESTLLEVGASSGQFLIHVRDRVREVNAIELDKACCAFLQDELSISADSQFLRESIFGNKTYDVVCAFQVMEHVDDPIGFLKDLRVSTKPGGAIFVEVPNLHDPLLSVWNVNSYQKFFYHSAHLHYFTESSLRKVAVAAGFHTEEIEISFTQDYNILNHLHWVMNDGPQANCHVGLNEISLQGLHQEIASWLTGEIKKLNAAYVDKLVAAKSTSNMIMKLKNGK